MYIWWLNQSQCAVSYELLEASPDKLPSYIADELHSRYGRPGRGRLWIHNSLPNVGVDPCLDTESSHQLSGEIGGIVFKEEDLELIFVVLRKNLNGLIKTDVAAKFL
jgi:hypothetical protein